MSTIPEVLSAHALGALVERLHTQGWTIVAPTVRDHAVVLAPVESVARLPVGVGDEQRPGHYRLHARDDDAWFGYAAPANSWKSFLYPATSQQAVLRRDAAGRMEIRADAGSDAPPRYAFLGVRACDLAAIAALDRVLLGGVAVDATYAARREQALLIAVACSEPSELCFCASMGTGPRPEHGYDLLLTELLDQPGGHRFVVQVGSTRGARLLDMVEHRPAGPDDEAAADAVAADAARRMGRRLDPLDARELLQRSREHPHWQDVARRCLACGSCTLACPTCFCTDTIDGDDVTGTEAFRGRSWASCFSAEFSYIHGGAVRSSIAARYRQWLSHKLSTWWDQYGVGGCVGCGRCTAWCPAGIDLVAEVAALGATEVEA